MQSRRLVYTIIIIVLTSPKLTVTFRLIFPRRIFKPTKTVELLFRLYLKFRSMKYTYAQCKKFRCLFELQSSWKSITTYYWASGLTLFFNSSSDSIRLSQVLHRNLHIMKWKSQIFFNIWHHTSLLRLLIILGEEAFLWKISVADARIFIWRRIPAYSKDKCL